MKEIIRAYPAEQRYCLAMMQDIQRRYNDIPREGMEAIAAYLGVPLAKLYAMTTFYKAFSLTPKGKHIVKLCDGTACHIRGGLKLLEGVQRLLGIEPGQTTKDGLFTLELVNCLGSCAIAPVILIDDKFYGRLTPDQLPAIFAAYQEDATEADGEEAVL